MTEQEKKTGETQAKAETDAKAETETKAKSSEPAAKQKPAAKATAPKSKAKSHAAGYLLLALLIVVAGAGAAGYYGFRFYQQQSGRMDGLADQLVQLQQANTRLKSQLGESLQTLNKQQAELANDIETLRSKNQFLRKDWLVMEAEYLLQLANYRLLFERDIKTAIVALNTADNRLRETGDPGLMTIRSAIADAVQALKAVPQPDLAGMSMTMSALVKDIPALPLNTPEPQTKLREQKNKTLATRQVKSWSALPAAIWRDLKSLIIIRNHEKPVEPLLPPDQRFFLIQNLRLQIEQARLAMLSGHAAVYKERLDTAIRWIEKYFDPAAAATQAALATLKQLRAKDIAPALPDISKPYQLLQTYRKQQAANAATK